MKKYGYDQELEERPFGVNGVNTLMWPTCDDGAWTGPKADWETQHSIQYFKHLKKFGTIVTAGGNCGMYSRLYSQMFEKVYVFEPDPLNFHCLVLNNQCDNVYKLQAALGAHPGLVRVRRGGMSNIGTHTVEEHPEADVPLITIDSLNLPELDIIQLDVEGFELEVFKGAFETINRLRPILIGENCGPNSPVHEYLHNTHGYRLDSQSAADSIYLPG